MRRRAFTSPVSLFILFLIMPCGVIVVARDVAATTTSLKPSHFIQLLMSLDHAQPAAKAWESASVTRRLAAAMVKR